MRRFLLAILFTLCSGAVFAQSPSQTNANVLGQELGKKWGSCVGQNFMTTIKTTSNPEQAWIMAQQPCKSLEDASTAVMTEQGISKQQAAAMFESTRAQTKRAVFDLYNKDKSKLH